MTGLEVQKGSVILAALNRHLRVPYSTFDGIDLYPTSIEKAAALFESLIISHPFVDGNKRISYVLLRMFLFEFGKDIVASQEDKYNFVLAASKGEIRYDQIKNWLSPHMRNKNAL